VRLRKYASELHATGVETLVTEVHPYALVGHQVSGWISGYLWARDLKMAYVGGALNKDPGGVFAFETQSNLKRSGASAKLIRLPAVPDERDPRAIEALRRKITASRVRYPNRDRVYRLSLDQPRWDLTPASGAVRQAVLAGPKARTLLEKEDASAYIAIHIRRGSDIGKSSHPNRWLTDEWYVPVIRSLREVPELNQMPVRIYALGNYADFPLLASEPGVELRLNGDRDEDFIDLCAAKLIVVAPSSFSFNAALVSQGVALVRSPWWHEVPSEGRWVRLGSNGEFLHEDVQRALSSNK
jgi:hypothetical protein